MDKTNKRDHASYIESEAWKERKQKLFEDHKLGDKCEVCRQEVTVSRGPMQRQVHHNNYYRKNSGVLERDEDLIVLCRPCHMLFHAKSRPTSYAVSAYEEQCSTCGRSFGGNASRLRNSRFRHTKLCWRCEQVFEEQLCGSKKTKKLPASQKPLPVGGRKVIRRRNGLVTNLDDHSLRLSLKKTS